MGIAHLAGLNDTDKMMYRFLFIFAAAWSYAEMPGEPCHAQETRKETIAGAAQDESDEVQFGRLTADQAKYAITSFLSGTDPRLPWFQSAAQIIKRAKILEDKETGLLYWGPWMVNPETWEVKLSARRFDLRGRIVQREAKII